MALRHLAAEGGGPLQHDSLKADLHVHSKYSKRPSQWILQKIGCPESFTEPAKLYELAKARGMDLVTITDHNTLAGSLEIAHLDGTFVSEEITTYFPEVRCKLHVLAFDITEQHHDEITRLRENVYELVPYLQQQDIIHVLAHPLFAINDRLTLEHFEQVLLLFKHFELNGTRDDFQNQTLAAILNNLTLDDIERLADKHTIVPNFDTPWEKVLTGGSDDHSSLNIARVHTKVEGARTIDTFLQGLKNGQTEVCGKASTPKSMGHNLYGIAYQFCRSKFQLERWVGKDHVLRFAESILTTSGEMPTLFCRLQGLLYRSPRIFKAAPKTFQGILLNEARTIVDQSPELEAYIRGKKAQPWDMEEDWFTFVNEASDRILKHFADAILDSFSGAQLFNVFHTMGSAGSLYTLLAPYFVAYTLFTKDRQFTIRCKQRFNPSDEKEPRQRLKMAHFTDTFHEKNGVAHALQMQLRIAGQNDKRYNILTCGPETDMQGVVNFDPIGTFELPEYSGLKLYYPPLLRMLDYCFSEGFTHIHSSTPGPIGLAALAIARILQLPIHGTYHTSFPQYAGELTEDVSLEEAMWKYMTWYYNQLDMVYVPSKATALELEERGVHSDKIRLYPQGIDTQRFSPAKRNGFLRVRHQVPKQPTKLLYVGRTSREKNLPLLAEAFAELARERDDLHLVIVGDGPYREEMENKLAGLPVTFTGFLGGEDLAQAYASSDVFVFPPVSDTFGNAVLEAQASGLPVIVADRGGPRENMIPGKTGTVFIAGDVCSFKQAITNVVDEPGLIRSMSDNARKHLENRSFEAAFLKTWDLYKDTAREEILQQAV